MVFCNFAFLHEDAPQESGGGSNSFRCMRFESVDVLWFLKTVSQLKLRDLGKALVSELKGKSLQTGYHELPEPLRIRLYEAHLQYMMFMTNAQQPAPVSLQEAMLGPGSLKEILIQEGNWYFLAGKRVGVLDSLREPADDGEIIVANIGVTMDQDGPVMLAELVQFKSLSSELQALLQGLHFPQSDPRIAAFLATPAGISRFGTSPRTNVGTPPGKPTDSATPEITPNWYQPFVGVNSIGAGNNIALYDESGKIRAYVDYGLPAPQNLNTYQQLPDHPCVCADAAMILSHWDYDHYAMVRMQPDALRRRWMAPQQLFGSVAARELYARLLNETPHGAMLIIWPSNAPAGHVPTDFGFIERANGNPVNDDGLVAYVRVAEDPAAAPAATALPMFGQRLKPMPAPTTGAGMVLNHPLICHGGLGGQWMDENLALPFHSKLIAVPAGAHQLLPAALPPNTAAGSIGQVQGGGAAFWIPAGGISLPTVNGGQYVPSIQNVAWAGGWAISALDFIKCGGMILDFPPKSTKQEQMVCVSPTPGTKWNSKRAPSGVKGAVKLRKKGWQPVWGRALTCWKVPLPAAAAGALLPLPAGPQSLIPMGSSAQITQNERYVLLPGDAGYQHIPSMAAWRKLREHHASGNGAAGSAPIHIVGLVATHHGSDSWIPDPPNHNSALWHIPPAPASKYWPGDVQCTPTAKIVYSYGTRLSGTIAGAHCYRRRNTKNDGHPRAAALLNYETAGWGVAPHGAGEFNRLNTAVADYTSNQFFNPLELAPGTLLPDANLKGHANGNVALGWDIPNASPLRQDHVPSLAPVANYSQQIGPNPLHRVCPTCNQVREFYF
ncbi:hypothetical protein HUX88_16810 [Duganella sp. BJB1802]|nr:hypothetical protein [Duganella sp. BJB1802]